MLSLNKVVITGRLTEDPVLHSSASGRKSMMFRIASNKRWKKDNVVHSSATFVTCKAFDAKAEKIAEFFDKGRPIYIEGELKQDEWLKPDGTKGRELRVYVTGWSFLDSRSANTESEDTGVEAAVGNDSEEENYDFLEEGLNG